MRLLRAISACAGKILKASPVTSVAVPSLIVMAAIRGVKSGTTWCE